MSFNYIYKPTETGNKAIDKIYRLACAVGNIEKIIYSMPNTMEIFTEPDLFTEASINSLKSYVTITNAIDRVTGKPKVNRLSVKLTQRGVRYCMQRERDRERLR